MWYSKIVLLLICLLTAGAVFGQHSKPDTIVAAYIREEISFDGKLTETFWQSSPAIENFTQRELSFGQSASEKTKVALLYDNNNIYIGVWCYQREKEKITAKFLQRDFDYSTDDNFQVIISPFNDKRNGYLFIINPNGARADLQVSGDNDNIDWNGMQKLHGMTAAGMLKFKYPSIVYNLKRTA